MRTPFDDRARPKSRRLADLKYKTAELERQLSDTRMSLERELAQFAPGRAADDETDGPTGIYAALNPPHGHGTVSSRSHAQSLAGRTEILVRHGRRSAYYRRLSRSRKLALIGTAAAAALVTILTMVIFSGGASWPPSVATVQSEATRACQNPDVRSEPGLVNFGCAPATRQILWVFALMTSANNPRFADPKTGRLGLEPITPAQGGEVAWSLNLHQPYSSFDPIDSLEVAARAINNIIGGATVAGANGNPVVEPGLESNAANCVRYTGSPAVTARRNFPGLCARAVTSAAGQAALVSDVYQKWVVGASAASAWDAAVLFENAGNPGDSRVQAILKHLAHSAPAA